MASAGTLIFELAADVSHLRADMAKANDAITSALDSIAKSTAATALMTGAEYAFNFAKGFAENIKGAIDAVDALNDLSERIGATTEELSGLQYVARLSGVEVDELTTGMRSLAKSMVDAKDPSSQASKALAAIGLSAKDLKNQNPAEAFITIAQAISGFKDGAEKTAVTMALFGDRVGSKFVSMMNQGRVGITELIEEAQRLGVIVDTETARSMGDLNDDLDRMKAASQGVYLKIAEDLTPAIKEVTRLMKEAKTAGTGMNEGLEILGQTAKTVIASMIGLGGTIASLAAVAGGFAGLAASLTKPGGMNEGLDAMAKGWQKGQNIMYETVNSMDTITHKLTEQEKAQKKAAAATKEAADAQEQANKKNLPYDPKTKPDKTAKAKTEIDEYGKMLDDLNKKMIALVSRDNPMVEMLNDPKFKKLTTDQQEALKELMNDYLDLKAATDQEKQAQSDLDKEQQKNAETINSFTKSVEDMTSSQLDAIDPLRVNAREMAQYTFALDHAIISQDEFNKLSAQSSKRLHDSLAGITPATEQTKALTEAIDGFGKQSADAFVEFATGADTLGNSFRKMVSDMLKELARMLVYQYVFKGLFNSASTTVGDWMKNMPSGTPSLSMGGPSSGASALSSSASLLGFAAPTSSGGGSLSGGGGGARNPAVTVNVTMHKDSSKDTQDTTASEKTAADLGHRIAAVVRQVISTEKRTGGLLSPSR